MNVANKTPKLRDVAIGIRNCACKLVSKSSGKRPTNVVREVRMIGLKRFAPADSIAFRMGAPFSLSLFIKSTKTRLSLTTTPAKATNPSIDKILMDWPIIQWPNIAPINPNGITNITING